MTEGSKYMKLGLKDPRLGAIKLELRHYVNYDRLPKPPEEFGNYPLIPANKWGMLANDQYGDCAIAGPAHQIMCWNKVASRDVPFTDDAALENYSAITGFSKTDPEGHDYPADDNPTDQGTALDEMAEYWRTHGLVDANGDAHEIEAYIGIDPGNLTELWLATYLFESVTLGFALPDSAIEQTQKGQIWDPVPGARIEGGHCVPVFGRTAGFGIGVTWGQLQPFTPNFYTTYNNQGIVALSSEMMTRAVSLEGFNDKELRGNLAELAKAA